jgi:hypothetical protein
VYDDCENCNAREAVCSRGVGGVETRLCGYCSATLEVVVNPLIPSECIWVFPDNTGNGWRE